MDTNRSKEELDLSILGQSEIKDKKLLEKIEKSNKDESKVEEEKDQNSRHSVYDFEIIKNKASKISRMRLAKDFFKIFKKNRDTNIQEQYEKLLSQIKARKEKKEKNAIIKQWKDIIRLRRLWEQKAIQIAKRKQVRRVLWSWSEIAHEEKQIKKNKLNNFQQFGEIYQRNQMRKCWADLKQHYQYNKWIEQRVVKILNQRKQKIFDQWIKYVQFIKSVKNDPIAKLRIDQEYMTVKAGEINELYDVIS